MSGELQWQRDDWANALEIVEAVSRVAALSPSKHRATLLDALGEALSHAMVKVLMPINSASLVAPKPEEPAG